jgi:hypothetical protein
MQKGDAELTPPSYVVPKSFEPCHMARHSRTVGAVHSAHIAWAQCSSLSIGGNEIILTLVPHMHGGTILDILRADEATNTWFVVVIILLGVGTLTLHGYDLQRVLIWIAFGRFVLLGALLLGYGDEHL